MSPVDLTIVVVYLAVCIVAGLWMRRFVHGVEDFAVAGRQMDLNLGIASLAATELGLVTVMYTAQLGFEKGMAGATVGVIMAAAMYVVGRTGFVIGPLRRAGVMTIPELFENRFGKSVRWLAGVFVALGGILNMGVFLRVGGEFLVNVTGASPDSLKLIMVGLLALVLLYTVLGGMLSVLITDYLQFIVMGLGIVVTAILVLNDIGWNTLVQQLYVAWDGTQAGGIPMKSHPFNPVHPSSFGWGYVFWQIVFQIAVVTTWQTQISRVLSARDEGTARSMYRRSAFYFVGRFALPGLFGVAAFLHFSAKGGLPEGIDSLTAMPAYLSTILPVGFLGLVVAAMLAAEMSTDSGYLLTWATVIYNDIITPCLRRPVAPRNRLLITRMLVLALGVFLVWYGLIHEFQTNVWDYLAVTGNIYLASVFTLLVSALYWRRANRMGAYLALVLGAVGPLSFLFLNGTVFKAHPISPAVAGFSSFALAFAGMAVGSLLTAPPASAASKEASA